MQMQEPSSDFNQKFTTAGPDCHKADAVENEKADPWAKPKDLLDSQDGMLRFLARF
jgi:hypothetical protein